MEICSYDKSFTTQQWYAQKEKGEAISKIHSRKVGRCRIWWFRVGADQPRTKVRKH